MIKWIFGLKIVFQMQRSYNKDVHYQNSISKPLLYYIAGSLAVDIAGASAVQTFKFNSDMTCVLPGEKLSCLY